MTVATMAAVEECETSGMTSYFSTKISGLNRDVRDRTLNLQRLTAQRNALNSRVRALRAAPASLFFSLGMGEA